MPCDNVGESQLAKGGRHDPVETIYDSPCEGQTTSRVGQEQEGENCLHTIV